MNLRKITLTTNTLIALALVAAFITGYFHHPLLYSIAEGVSGIFINLLKLVSVPIIFLSIVSTVSSMESFQEFKSLGKRVIKYTLLTTLLASLLAWLLFIWIQPVRAEMETLASSSVQVAEQGSYVDYLSKIIPSNFLHPFVENQVISVLFLAMLLSLAILTLPSAEKKLLHSVFNSIYKVMMKVTGWVILLMPLAIWSFVTLFVKEMRSGLEIESILLYLVCILAANLIQGVVVLPIFVKLKGVSPLHLAKNMLPALSVAFFTKSSSATLPFAMRCCESGAGLNKKTINFTLPLCTTINMNGCAAFILTTVLFVSMSNGIHYSWIDQIAWVFIAVVAAVGNAGVPMGCFFLSSALLASLNVPLYLLGVILPFYTLIDMVETALNVWSDSCVVAVVDRELSITTEVTES